MKILLLSLAAVPLIRDTSVFFADSAGKIFFTRSVLALVGVLLLSSFIFNKSFREDITRKVLLFVRNPLVLSVSCFVILFALSAVFAVDTYTAFWGDVQRGEGLVGIVYFFALFIFSLLIFERKDWLWFFKLSLIAAAILLLREFLDLFSGTERPGSFVGNPTFLAGYLIFAIFYSTWVFKETSGKFWKYISAGVFVLSFPGIFITETRGAILGLVLGAVLVLAYFSFRGSEVRYKNLDLKKLSIIILSAVFIFSALFLTTRKAEFWQSVPGLARVAAIGSQDISTQTRLLGINSSLRSVAPEENGWKKLILGWGPNNYILAFGEYYNAEQYKYEIEWFDRAHNRILDALVANGLLGLLAYLSIWLFYFKKILRQHRFSFETASFTFLGIAFLVHLLFVFDNISTSVSLFMILAFTAGYPFIAAPSPQLEARDKRGTIYAGTLLAVLALFLCFVFLRGDAPAYLDMKEYLSFKRTNQSVNLEDIDSVFSPFTIAQKVIRQDFLLESVPATTEKSAGILSAAFLRAEEYIEKMPNDFRFLAAVAGAYTRQGNEKKDITLLKKGEEYLRKVLVFSPERPDFGYGLSLNLVYQKRYTEAKEVLDKVIAEDSGLADSYYYYGIALWFEGEESYAQALEYFEKVFNLKPWLFKERIGNAESIYSHFVQYFYNKRDKARFNTVAHRLIENKHPQSSALAQLLLEVEKGSWPRVQFNSQ